MLAEVEEFCRARTEEGVEGNEGEGGAPSEEGIVVPVVTSLPDLVIDEEDNDDSDDDDIQSDTAEEFVVIDVAMEADQFDEGA